MNKEQIYDDQIAPLVTKILEVCQQNGIAMIASFDIAHEGDPGLRCTSQLPDGNGNFTFSRVAGLLMSSTPSPLMLTTRDGDGKVTAMTAIIS
jgi:hypothetical protein